VTNVQKEEKRKKKVVFRDFFHLNVKMLPGSAANWHFGMPDFTKLAFFKSARQGKFLCGIFLQFGIFHAFLFAIF